MTLDMTAGRVAYSDWCIVYVVTPFSHDINYYSENKIAFHMLTYFDYIGQLTLIYFEYQM